MGESWGSHGRVMGIGGDWVGHEGTGMGGMNESWERLAWVSHGRVIGKSADLQEGVRGLVHDVEPEVAPKLATSSERCKGDEKQRARRKESARVTSDGGGRGGEG